MRNEILFIMPSKNRESIHRAVRSVKSQTDARWHLCIVYDSVDDPKIKQEKKITCINLEKKLGRARNRAALVRNIAIDRLQNEYPWIGFIDDDDIIDKNYVHWVFSKYKENDLVIFRMKTGYEPPKDILPPRNSNEIEVCKVGISFCFKTPVKTRFKPSGVEDYRFLVALQKEKPDANWIITEEVGYYVRDAFIENE